MMSNSKKEKHIGIRVENQQYYSNKHPPDWEHADVIYCSDGETHLVTLNNKKKTNNEKRK